MKRYWLNSIMRLAMDVKFLLSCVFLGARIFDKWLLGGVPDHGQENYT